MKPVSMLCLALALAACSPKTETPADASKPPEGATAKRVPLPDCATVQPVDAGPNGWAHPDCRLQASDSKGLAFEARYTQPNANQEATITIQVVAPGDATLQTITEKMQNTGGAPELQDIDEDGRQELLIPIVSGNVNTDWQVYRATGDSAEYRQLEILSGIGIKKTESGYIAVAARGAANMWGVAFWKFDSEDLELIATANVTAHANDKGEIEKVDCLVFGEDATLAEVGLSQASAKVKFCAEPIVADIFK